MKRRDVLKAMLFGAGFYSLPRSLRMALAMPGGESESLVGDELRDRACWVTPELPAGPFYFDPGLLRQDIREDRQGVLLELEMTVIDENCVPQPDVLVDVWHCDKDGCYSGYNQATCDAVGETFMRGTQVTDAGGRVNFTTIYPGWYPGRATHVHFKVRTESESFKTSQFAFPDAVNEEVYNSPLYADRGQNPTSNAQDVIFGSDNPEHLMIEVEGDPESGYAGTFTIGLEGMSTSSSFADPAQGLRLERWPTVFSNQTRLQASLPASGYLTLTIYDTRGRRVRQLDEGWYPAGSFASVWDGRDDRGRALPAGVYFAALEQDGRQASARLVRLR